jgi:hypothetical protein
VSRIGDNVFGRQSEEERRQAMIKKSISITSAMLITLSLPLAQAAIKISDTISVDDLSRETLAKKTLKQVQASAAVAAERESLAPWEQQAVETVLPLLQAATANTASAIEYFRETRGRLWTAAYRDCADRVWQDSEQIAKILKDYLKYDKLRAQEIRLEERIWAESQRDAE